MIQKMADAVGVLKSWLARGLPPTSPSVQNTIFNFGGIAMKVLL
jgi:hypothetical protein